MAPRDAASPAQDGGAPRSRPRRILVVRLGAIGDCLRLLPTVVRLRRAFPEAEIGWAVGDLVAPLLQGHPAITRLHLVRRAETSAGLVRGWREIRRAGAELAAARYEVAIDFHTRLKSGLLVRASAAPLRIGVDRYSGSEANFLFTNRHVRLEDIYENRVMRFARLLAPLGLDAEPGDVGAALWIAPAVRAWAESVWKDAGRPSVAVFPGTSAHRAGDRWPLAKWRDLAARLAGDGLDSMVLWGPGEIETAAAIVEAGGGRVRLAPPTTLPAMAALLGHFRAYVGTNTAALHMAWMQGVAAVVLAGGRPWRTDRPLPPVASAMLSAGGVEPARKLRGAAAKAAIEGIEAEEVMAALRRLLAGGQAP